MTQENIERREFLKQAAAAAAIGFALPAGRVLGANDLVRLGIIGAGARGQELMHEFVEVPNAEFVAVADAYTRRHDEAKAIAPGITQAFRDYRRLLDLKEVDAVIVATPLHCRASLRSLQIHQLALVLGILRRQRYREYGAPDRLDHLGRWICRFRRPHTCPAASSPKRMGERYPTLLR